MDTRSLFGCTLSLMESLSPSLFIYCEMSLTRLWGSCLWMLSMVCWASESAISKDSWLCVGETTFYSSSISVSLFLFILPAL